MRKIQIKLISLLTVSMLFLANCNIFNPEKEDNNSTLAALLLLVSLSETASPTAGEEVCDGLRATGTTPLTVTGNISASTTWSGSVKLSGTVTVQSGATLTIAPNTVIFGETGSSLFVVQGAKLSAIGTAAKPICFTSAKSVGGRAPGNWGGVVLIGNAKGTRSGTTEGVNKLNYGSGTDDNDSSGTLQYVIIEFAGNEVSAGDELNGLSSYTVGNGTSVNYVQIHRGLDDGFEWWGGNMTAKHLIVTGGMDDDFDMDEGFRGNLQYIISVKYPTACGGTNSSDPRGFEMDGMHSVDNCTTGAGCSNPTVANFTTIGDSSITSSNAASMVSRDGMKGTFSEGIAYGYVAGITCAADNTSGDPPSSSFSKVISDKALVNNSSCSGTVSNVVTTLPITSLGAIDATNCGNGTNKPDFTTIADYSSQAAGAVDPAAPYWWANWTVYRSK